MKNDKENVDFFFLTNWSCISNAFTAVLILSNERLFIKKRTLSWVCGGFCFDWHSLLIIIIILCYKRYEIREKIPWISPTTQEYGHGLVGEVRWWLFHWWKERKTETKLVVRIAHATWQDIFNFYKKTMKVVYRILLVVGNFLTPFPGFLWESLRFLINLWY